MSIELKVELKMGPVTIAYEAPEDAELFWISDSEFIQKIMDLMDFIGTEEDPPEDPAPPDPRYLPFTSVMGTGNLTVEAPDLEIPGQGSLLDQEGEDLDDFFDTEDSAVGAQGTVVGRVSGVREVRAS